MWAYRTDPVVENQPTSQPTMDAAVDTRLNSGEDAVIEQNTIQHDPDSVCPEHFGTFDSNKTLYSGFNDGAHISQRPLIPSQTNNDTSTPNISAACPSGFADGVASCQSMVSLSLLNNNNLF